MCPLWRCLSINVSPPKRQTDHQAVTAGLAILALVVSENQALRNQGSSLFFALSLIAIPLCFFCFGMLAHTATEQRSLSSLILGTIKVYCIGIVLYAPKQITAIASPDLASSLQALVWGTGNSLYNAPLWLLTALVPGLCLYRMGIVGGKPLGERLWGPLIPVVGIGASYWLLSSTLARSYLPHDLWERPIGLPFSLDLSPLVASLLLLGAWYQAHHQEVSLHIHNQWPAWLSIVAIGAAFLIMVNFDPALDLNYRVIQAWPAALLATLVGMALCVMASQLLCINACKARLPLALLGRNGLIILLVHAPIQNAIVNALPETSQRSPLAVVAASVILCLSIAGIGQCVLNRHSLIKRIVYV